MHIHLRQGDPSPSLMQKQEVVYDALIELLELLAGFSAREELQSKSQDEHCYLMIAILHQQLLRWFSKLPQELRWSPANIEEAPSSFFSLQYVLLKVQLAGSY